MRSGKCSLLSFILVLSCANGSLVVPPFPATEIHIPPEGDVGKPLILTPYLEKNNYAEAQQLSKVIPAIGNETSYSGFFTVNVECDSNLFFWFFPAQKDNWKDLPVLLWLEGGPGSTFMSGLFKEIGPFEYSEKVFRKRKYAWNIENNLLIIDQPVGVGYSFTGGKCYHDNVADVGEDLYSAVTQFFQLFPSLQGNKFFIGGEYFAGHYIPAIGHTILKNNPSAQVKINLKAMMIGNGLSDPVTQMDYGSFLYQIGLVDDEGRRVYSQQNAMFIKEVKSENWDEAAKIWTNLVGDLYNKYVGGVNRYNFIQPQPTTANKDWEEFIQTPEIRNALHVGGGEFNRLSFAVYFSLLNDIPKSVKPWVEELLEHYPIVFYYGQLDIMCGYPMAINFIRSMSWSGQLHYLTATRTKWCVGQEQAGFFKGQHRLYDVLVRGAGQAVPADKPHWAYELLSSVISGSPRDPLHALQSCTEDF